MSRVVFSTLEIVCLLFGHVHLRVDIFALEIEEKRESFRLVAIEVLHNAERGLKLLYSHLLLKSADADFIECILSIFFHCFAHIHDLLAFALLVTLVLHLVEDLFKIGVLHESLVGTLGEFTR